MTSKPSNSLQSKIEGIIYDNVEDGGVGTVKASELIINEIDEKFILLSDHEKEISSLKKEIEELRGKIDMFLEIFCDNRESDIKNCSKNECVAHSIIDCPHSEPFHYHHDGCPACYRTEMER